MRTGALGRPLLAGLAALTLVGGCSRSSAPGEGAAFARNYVLDDNFVDGTVPTGAAGNCIGGSTAGATMFVDPAMGDFHSPIAAGAYIP